MYQRRSQPSMLEISPGEAPVFPNEPGLVALGQGALDAKYGRVTAVGKAEALPFLASSFDVVIVSRVFCSVADPRHALNEVARVLRPDGVLVGAEHCRNPIRLFARMQDIYSSVRMRRGLCRSGLDVLAMLEQSCLELEQFRKPRAIRPWLAFRCRLPR